MKNIIFPAYPGASRQLNPYFQKEAEAAKAAGFGISLVSDEATPGALTITNRSADTYIYRGWIVSPSYYQEMCQAAEQPLLVSYQDYMSSYNFPNWYAKFDTQDTPETLIIDAAQIVEQGIENVAQQVKQHFGSQPLVMKDYLKSLKHEWYDACYIKDASDDKEILRIMTNFFNLRGRDFVGGLVFRKFLALKRAGVHPKTRVPVPVEYRTFFLHGKPISNITYWEVQYPEGTLPPPQDFLDRIGKKLISPFVGLDLAQGEDDKWWVIEVNDGGSAGYPDYMNSQDFYNSLYAG
jgi:ATP-grasp domain, R2K clade family 3